MCRPFHVLSFGCIQHPSVPLYKYIDIFFVNDKKNIIITSEDLNGKFVKNV